MNKETLIKELQIAKKASEQLQANIKNMEEELNKQKGRWKPRNGEEFFYADNVLTIFPTIKETGNCVHDILIKSFNCYKTKEEAEQALELQTIENELCALIEEINDGWIPDWKDGFSYKYFISFDYNTNTMCCPINGYLKNIKTKFFCKREFLQDAVDRIGDQRLTKYLKNC